MWKMNIILYLFVQHIIIFVKSVYTHFTIKKPSVHKLCQLFTSNKNSILKLSPLWLRLKSDHETDLNRGLS